MNDYIQIEYFRMGETGWKRMMHIRCAYIHIGYFRMGETRWKHMLHIRCTRSSYHLATLLRGRPLWVCLSRERTKRPATSLDLKKSQVWARKQLHSSFVGFGSSAFTAFPASSISVK